jgi:3-isopropylmalate dehydrogenase
LEVETLDAIRYAGNVVETMNELMNQRESQTGWGTRKPLWSDFVFAEPVWKRTQSLPLTLGVLKGEGIGPEVIDATLRVFAAVQSVGGLQFTVKVGGIIGAESEAACGKPLSDEVTNFCREIFSVGGAILSGPGGGRFVYDLRREFDLFCKLSPLRVSDALLQDTRFKPEHLKNVDILLVRENVGGLYQGKWSDKLSPNGERSAEQSFAYTESQVRRIIEIAARIAANRRGKLSVIVKDGGVPAITALWRECATDIARVEKVELSFLNIDLAAYRLVQLPHEFDVIVAPNLFGDVLADLGGALLGSRALSFSGNFSATSSAVYQTNHGAAYDLAGKNLANPAGQMFSLAMLLRESFGLTQEAQRIENAVTEIWRDGWRTADLCSSGQRRLGTREMGELVAEKIIARK